YQPSTKIFVQKPVGNHEDLTTCGRHDIWDNAGIVGSGKKTRAMGVEAAETGERESEVARHLDSPANVRVTNRASESPTEHRRILIYLFTRLRIAPLCTVLPIGVPPPAQPQRRDEDK